MFALTFFVVTGTSIWVFFDAKSIGIQKGSSKGFLDMGPVGWSLSCFLLWIVAFPIYMAKRNEFKHTTELPQRIIDVAPIDQAPQAEAPPDTKTERSSSDSSTGLFCPKCGHIQENAIECEQCGIIFSKIRHPSSLLRMPTDCAPINHRTHTMQAGRLMPNKTWIVMGALIVAVGLIAFVAGKNMYSTRHTIMTVSTDDNPRDLLDDQMGWGRIPDSATIELVGVIKGAYNRGYGDEDFPVPALKLAVRNNGDTDLKSFGIDYTFSDIDNNRIIATYGIASGFIKAGWTSKIMMINVEQAKYLELIGGGPINFRVKAEIWVKTNNGAKTLYETVFEPDELYLLPKLQFQG
jgi:hypothetical protein